MRKPSWAARVVSYWRTRRRWWLIHLLVRSTTQRRGWTMNPSVGFGPETMSGLIPAAVAASAGVVPVYPLSAHTFVTVLVSQPVSRSANAARSWTFAGVACTPSRRPVVSTRMWRLIPSIFLAPLRRRQKDRRDQTPHPRGHHRPPARRTRHARERPGPGGVRRPAHRLRHQDGHEGVGRQGIHRHHTRPGRHDGRDQAGHRLRAKTHRRVHRPTPPLGRGTHQQVDQPPPTPRTPVRDHPGRPRRLPHPVPDRAPATPTRQGAVVRHALGLRPVRPPVAALGEPEHRVAVPPLVRATHPTRPGRLGCPHRALHHLSL